VALSLFKPLLDYQKSFSSKKRTTPFFFVQHWQPAARYSCYVVYGSTVTVLTPVNISPNTDGTTDNQRTCHPNLRHQERPLAAFRLIKLLIKSAFFLSTKPIQILLSALLSSKHCRKTVKVISHNLKNSNR
jgi:hypothetical protein